MANYAVGVNPAILKWARVESGRTVEEVAVVMRKSSTVIASWESGDSVPTYNQLEKLAYRLYKRPVAVFFFSEPPQLPGARGSFRTLPDLEFDLLQPSVRYAIRLAQARQFSLSELAGPQNPVKNPIFRRVHIQPGANVSAAAEEIREILGVTLNRQSEWRDPWVALGEWREAIEDAGIYVFREPLSQNDVSGFCLLDREYPVIFLNSSTAKTRQIFSLLHELAHILAGTSGITELGERYLKQAPGWQRSLEVLCNALASEILVPVSHFESQLGADIDIERTVRELAVAS